MLCLPEVSGISLDERRRIVISFEMRSQSQGSCAACYWIFAQENGGASSAAKV